VGERRGRGRTRIGVRRTDLVVASVGALALAAILGGAWLASFVPIRDARAEPFRRGSAASELGPYVTAAVREASWPMFGASPARARFVPSGLEPPFRLLYKIPGRGLIEMPPVISDGHLVFGTHEGRVIAARVQDGATLWTTNIGGCIASSPAVRENVVYVGWSSPAPCHRGKSEDGGVVALSLETGEILWRFASGNVESSPAVVADRLFFSAFRTRHDSTV